MGNRLRAQGRRRRTAPAGSCGRRRARRIRARSAVLCGRGGQPRGRGGAAGAGRRRACGGSGRHHGADDRRGAPDPAMTRLAAATTVPIRRRCDAERRTALFYAARADQAATIRALQQAGARSMHATAAATPRSMALAVGAEAAAAALRSLGVRANLVAPRPAGRTASSIRRTRATSIAAGRRWRSRSSRNDAAAVQQLLERGRRCAICACRRAIRCSGGRGRACDGESAAAAGARRRCDRADHAGHSVLWLAATRNDIAVIKALLRAGVPPMRTPPPNRRPLLAALRAAHPKSVAAACSTPAPALKPPMHRATRL